MSGDANYPAMKLLQLAAASLRAGRLAEAQAQFEQVLAHEPANATALYELARLARDRGEPETARSLLEGALAADGDHLPSLVLYGQHLHETGRPREALDVFLRVLAIDSAHAELWNAAGICFQETGEPVRAMEFYLKAMALEPKFAEPYNNLGVVLSREGDMAGAAEHFRQALGLNPEYAECHSNLGVVLRDQHRYGEAIAAFREAYRLRPQNAENASCLGEAMGLIYEDGAETMLRRGVELRPEDAEKHWNLALELLKRGDYAAGWREFEWRWQRTQKQAPLPAFEQPYWRGEPGQELKGTTILLHAEQGYGDTIQFLRYVPLVVRKGARVLLRVQPALQRLVSEYARSGDGSVSVLGEGEPLQEFDWHAPLMSLPGAFGTTLENVPAPLRLTPKLDGGRVRRAGQALRVGLAWAGNPSHDRDRERSIPLDALPGLFEEEGCEWVSLQTEPAVAQLRGSGIAFEQPVLADFLDTAAVMDTVDVVIAVDTAVAHLAASQGVETWILLPFVADWRWLRPETEHAGPAINPWYPEARIFRQRELPSGQAQVALWRPVIAEVKSALASLRDAREQSAFG
jgi:Tfp pilus assembly protein PilF